MVQPMLLADNATSDDITRFDSGPLSWVQAEIDEALAKSLDALEAFAAAPQDGTHLKHARTHVHQAAGAIQMVGLDAVAAFTDEVERQLARLEELGPAEVAAACAPIDRACRKLRIFLDELVGGAAPVPLKLFPEYEAMQRARAVRAVTPTDLFFPDLSAHAPRMRRAVPADLHMPSFLVKQRRLFQRGLLAWLRGHEDGARQMREAIGGIEEATSQPSLRAFWWSTGALLDALIERGLEGSFGVKQLAARVDLQIRRLAEGSSKVADRLRREVLYYVAISAPVAPSVEAVQRVFSLTGLIPSAEVLSADVVGIQPHLREARDQLATAKDTWLKYTSGRAENLPKLKQTFASVHKHAASIGNGALMKLTSALVSRLDRMANGSVPEAMAMEFATALLLAESAFRNYANLSADFSQHVDVMLARLDAAQASRPFEAGADAPVLEEMSRRAQDRMLLAQVGREIQANLRHMEQVLDAFFRDHDKRGELVALVKDSAQVRGALRMLELHTAEALLASCEEQIASYADAATPIADEDLELLAESLSGLGFYIEAVEQQRVDHERLIAPILAKRRGETVAPVVEQADTVEAAVEELRNALPELINEVHRAPADMQARESLRQKLTVLRDDAELIGDAELVASAKAALTELEQGATGGAAITAIAENAAPAPAPELSQETQRLLDSGEHALDAELLDIFLAEAAEVLDTVSEQHRILGHNAADREALRTARRQFHTLKGSGRMVGLTDLAEIAYDVEKIHNRLLEEERAVTPAVLALIATGEAEFRAWVAELRDNGYLRPDPQRVHAAIRAVEAELPRGRESVLKGREQAPVAPSRTTDEAPASAAPVAPITPVTPLDLTLVDRAALAPAEVVPIAQPAVADAELSDAEALESVLAAYRGVELELNAVEAAPDASTRAESEVPHDLESSLQPPTLDVPVLLAEVGATATEPPLLVVEAIDESSADRHDDLPPLVIDLIEGGSAPIDIAASDAHPAQLIHLTGSGEASRELSPITEIDLELPDPDAVVQVGEHADYVEDAEALEHIDVAMRGAIQSVEEIVAAAPPNFVPHLTLVGDSSDGQSGSELERPPVVADEQSIVNSQGDGAPSEPALDDSAQAAGVEELTVSDEVVIGEVRISRSLYEILIAEADEHLAILSHELAVMQFEPGYLVSAAIVRASHTLCGIHRTGGFALVPATAKALEQCLLAIQQRNAAVSESSQAILAHAVDVLSALVARVREHDAFTEADARQSDEVQRELETLRQEMQLAPNEALVQDAAQAEAPVEVELRVAAPSPAESAAPIPSAAEPAQLQPAEAEAAAPHAITQTVDETSDVVEHQTLPLGEITEPPAPTETPLDQIHDEVDEQLLPIFLEEAEELFPQAGEQLRSWRRNPQDQTHASALRRTLHTFKGSARMAGAMRLGELAHRMESRLLRGEELEPGSVELFEALDADLDRVAFVLDALREGRSNIALPWLDPMSAAAVATQKAAEARPVVDQPSAQQAVSSVVVPLPGVTGFAAQPSIALGGAAETDSAQRAVLRVRADVIDRLVNETGEVAIARSRVEGELRALKANLLELTNSVIRMREQVREIEIQAESQIQSRLSIRGETQADFDPLEFDRFTRFQELTRSLAEGVNDVSTVQQSLMRNLDDADSALAAQSRLSRDIQQQLFSIRTVPFGSLSERLYRILRQVAKELDKRVNLDIRGSQVELDRSVLEKLVGPLEHLLRNALDHGIESREVRAQSGKPTTGEIVVTVRQVGNEIAIELADDGAGLDLERIRARAVAQGRIAADAQTSEAQLVECIFQPGFSTASRVTHVSGRGIGMDVVRAEIAALGGRVEVSTRPGKGTTFLLYLPLTLAVAQAVLVRAGGRLWALPSPMVEQVQQVKAENLIEMYANRRLRWQNRSYSFHYLPRLLGDTEHSPVTGKFNPVLLLRTGQGVTAVHVDEMVGNQEVVVKNIGPQLARVAGIAGATVLGSGEIVLIINPVQLAQRADIPDFNPFAEEHIASTAYGEATLRLPLAMVVDDSLTVRKITSRLLAREGFDVVTAKDGIEALQRLEDRCPDVILLDIEMPRMDGFEFAKTIKADARHANIPIIMITSRTAEKHRNRARELGVDLYLGKPYQEQDLLRNLREMLSVAA